MGIREITYSRLAWTWISKLPVDGGKNLVSRGIAFNSRSGFGMTY